MRIVCIGGGPAGLYFALLMKKQNPDHQITVVERNRPFDTFGWGVVLSDQTMDNLKRADAETAQEILDAFARWDDVEVRIKGRTITSGGHGFCGIGRKRLLNILQHRCQALGVELLFETEVKSDLDYPDADLIIASDGVNSVIRNRYADVYQPDIDTRKCRYIWLGVNHIYDAFTFAFEKTEHGWFQAHAYKFDEATSTFIIETPEDVWHAQGLDQMDGEQTLGFCEELFKEHLGGAKLMTNARHLRGSAWIKFNRVVCNTWVHHNGKAPVVLMGDAAHTAHFSIGSGTKLALEDAIDLANRFATSSDIPAVLKAYQAERSVEVLKIQNAARNSTEWFENVARYADLPPEQFAYSLLTRSQRISHENLRLRDKSYVAGIEEWFAGRPGRLPMMTPFKLGDMTVANRVVVSPMAVYSAENGVPGDFHLVHFGSRALGGAGLLFTEMTCIAPEARITPGCCGLWNDEQQAAWKRIVDFVHANSPAKIALQLGHAGPKGSTRPLWEGMNKPLADGNWPLIAPSAIPYTDGNQTPRAMTRADMDAVLADFVSAAKRGAEAGFDLLELHCAHGYLLSAFLSPLTNTRTDDYGGSLENRARYPLEVFKALRAAWPKGKPLSVRLSAHDWAPGGNTGDDAVALARLFKDAGADLIDVSSGQVVASQKPVYGRMFQTPFADRIRNEVGIATLAVGAITEGDQVNSILMAGRADLCALARPHLADPAWTLHEAAKLGVKEQWWPKQYISGKRQLETNLARAAQITGAV
jgi:anthraniloyl-CoA monooxygenase